MTLPNLRDIILSPTGDTIPLFETDAHANIIEPIHAAAGRNHIILAQVTLLFAPTKCRHYYTNTVYQSLDYRPDWVDDDRAARLQITI